MPWSVANRRLSKLRTLHCRPADGLLDCKGSQSDTIAPNTIAEINISEACRHWPKEKARFISLLHIHGEGASSPVYTAVQCQLLYCMLSASGIELIKHAGNDMHVLVWRVADMIQAGSQTPKPIIMKSRHSAAVFTANFSCDNQFIYSGGNDFKVIKHDFITGKAISNYEHCNAVYSVAPHPSSSSIVLTASKDGYVYIIDTRQPHSTVDRGMVLCGPTASYRCVVYNPVEPRLVAVCNSCIGTALYDTRQRKSIVHYKSTRGGSIAYEDASSVSFDRTGQQLYVVRRNLPPCLYDIWHEEVQHYFIENTESHRNAILPKSGCFMGQNDEYVVSGSNDYRVYVWKIPNTCRNTQPFMDKEDKEVNLLPHLILPGHQSAVNHACYSKVHHVLATSGVERIIKIWSHEWLNSSQKVSHSGNPPSPRLRLSITEWNRLVNPSDSLFSMEDSSMLAQVDAIMEERETVSHQGPWSHLSDSYFSSSEDDFDEIWGGEL